MIEPTDEMRRAGAKAIADADLAPNNGTPEEYAEPVIRAVLAIVERDQAAELAELRALFDLQWTRSREADAMWRAEDPEKRANVWPDLGDLLAWLMERNQAVIGYKQAVATLRGVVQRTGSPAARWAAEYLEADPDRLGPVKP